MIIHPRTSAALAALLLAAFGCASAQVALPPGSSHSQDFDALSASGTGNAWTDNGTLTGWYSSRVTYNAGTGSSNAGALYSFGTDADRALGSVASGGTGTLCHALRLANVGATPITGLDIAFAGEQWRNGGNTSAHTLRFSYRISDSSAAPAFDCAGTGWTSDPTFDFTGPTSGASSGALDGNAGANRVVIDDVLAVSVAPGEDIWLRWVDLDESGSDHGLAIDDLVVGASGVPSDEPTVSFAPGNLDLSITEGNSGSQTLAFTVLVDPAPDVGAVSFDVAVSGSGANPTDGADLGYAGPATVVVNPGDPTTVLIEVDVFGDVLVEPNETFSVVLSNFSGTDPVQPATQTARGTLVNDDIPTSEIWQLQGNGLCSPRVPVCDITQNISGDLVRSELNVVTTVGPRGFTLQTPDGARDDNDAATSNGIYVLTFDPPLADDDTPVAVGDVVSVGGRLVEFFGLTEISVSSARNGDNSIVIVESDADLPTPIEFSSTSGIPSPDPDALSCPAPDGSSEPDSNFECFESMRVSIPQGLVTTSHQRFGGDTLAEVWISVTGERSLRNAGVRFGNTPGAGNPGAGIWDGNPDILEMDIDTFLDLPPPAGFDGIELFGGTTFAAVGVIGFDFGDYEFWPSALAIDDGSNVLPQPVPPAAVNELTVASYNALRLCDTLDDRNGSTIAFTCSDELEADPAGYGPKLAQVSAYVREVLGSPAVVGMQEVEKLVVLQDTADRIAADGGPVYAAYLIEGNDPGGIDVGYLVDTARVGNVSVTQLAADEMWDDPSGGLSTLHDRPPLLLEAEFDNGDGLGFGFTLINNHLRSRGGVDVSNANGQRVRAKRFTQGASIAGLVQAYQTDPANEYRPLLLIGDYNAYEFTDGFVDLVGLISGTYDNDENTCAPANGVTDCELPGNINIVDPPLSNLVLTLPPNARYSFNFTENLGAIQGSAGRDVSVNQVLDHGLANSVAQEYVSGFAFGRANLDASLQRIDDCTWPDIDEAACGVAPGGFSPIGSSDHEGFVVYFDTDCSDGPAAADPDGDGVCSAADNCPLIGNPGQQDSDDDGIGDACDIDMPVGIFGDGFEGLD